MSSETIIDAMCTSVPVPMLQRSPVIVLGMHRSGTSALAGGLEHLGISLGHRLYAQNEWNLKGYFEEEEIVRFNNTLLRDLGRRWDTLLPAPEADFSLLGDRMDAAIDMLSRLFSASPHWGFKDPRMCMLQPFWDAVFRKMQLTPKLLITVRDPNEVVWSLHRRDGIASSRAAWLWLTQMIGALSYVEAHCHARLVLFDRLLAQPAAMLNELASWLALSPDAHRMAAFAEQFIEPGLTQRPDEPQLIPPLVSEAYAVLTHAAASDVDPYTFRNSEPWQHIVSRFAAEAQPVLQAIDRFFEGDQQLDFLDARNMALSAGLAHAEALARQRLAALAEADLNMRRLTDAFADAERLAYERLKELERLNVQWQTMNRSAQEETQRASQMVLVMEREKQQYETLMREQRDALEVATLAVNDHASAMEKRLHEIAENETLIASLRDRLTAVEHDRGHLAKELFAIQESRTWKVLKRLRLVNNK